MKILIKFLSKWIKYEVWVIGLHLVGYFDYDPFWTMVRDYFEIC